MLQTVRFGLSLGKIYLSKKDRGERVGSPHSTYETDLVRPLGSLVSAQWLGHGERRSVGPRPWSGRNGIGVQGRMQDF